MYSRGEEGGMPINSVPQAPGGDLLDGTSWIWVQEVKGDNFANRSLSSDPLTEHTGATVCAASKSV